MTSSNVKRRGLAVLPLAIVPVVFLTSAPSLKTAFGSEVTTWLAAAASIFVMGYAWYCAARFQRGQDEVQKAGADYAARWGVVGGQITFFVLLALPPFQDFVAELVNQPRGKVLLGMTIGACGIVLLQAVGTIVANMVWWRARR